MFNEYLKKILPIPIINMEVNNDGYKYRITTYASVIDERGTETTIRKRLNSNKRIKDISGWYFLPNDYFYKQMIIEFKHEN